MLGGDIARESGGGGVASVCACSSLLAAVLLGIAAASASSCAIVSAQPGSLPHACSFDSLTFYYDDDGALQCECLDDLDAEDDWLQFGAA